MGESGGSFTETIFDYAIPVWLAIPIGIAVIVIAILLIRGVRKKPGPGSDSAI